MCSQSAPDSQETRDRRWLCPPACHSKHTREIKSRLSGKKRGVAGVEPASRSSVHMEEGSRVGKATHLPQPPLEEAEITYNPGKSMSFTAAFPVMPKAPTPGHAAPDPARSPGLLA